MDSLFTPLFASISSVLGLTLSGFASRVISQWGLISTLSVRYEIILPTHSGRSEGVPPPKYMLAR